MRIGLMLQGSSCRALVLEGRSVISAAEQTQASSLAEALDRVLSELRLQFGSRITDVTADVGRVLGAGQPGDVVAIRISPRPPADRFHNTSLPALIEPAVIRTMHVRGGHDLRGRPLAPLDLKAFLVELPSILSGGLRNVAITAVGSTASPEHETRIADAILSNNSDMRISISSDFYSSVFRDRDYTAVLNSALMESGEGLAAMLEEAGQRHFPSATLSYARNDGGRAPLARLAVAPVHALRPEPAMAILGAATLGGLPDGEVVVCTDEDVSVGNMRRGLPVAHSLIRQGYEAGLATNAAIVEPYTANHLVRHDIPSVVADARTSQDIPPDYGLVPTLPDARDLTLIGCAATPLTAWIDRLESVSGQADLQRVQNRAEEEARSAAVQLGASPTETRIIESNVFAMPYGNPGIVRIRVQAAGGTSSHEEHGLATHSLGATA
ncbi:N-methylhydantoinase A/acetone carboxylase beta subunit-like protein [Arthrobacter sp. FB24]|uniref:hydantoinase/oxoprolinase N-terminal domain-containing protein n=1 Tax=Arthrobacter sp. (strain FB24) TaxID=290399 RepID=UPI0000526931|nr:hydantoinase/oxoprolinase N-terminal domain-containing protein [Arthrobacter sp. FB24]ABK05021.1 N-methylhydantoinase A/acetone carboxylase beta subunit-like protein [Arthrobacter sp. FB24]